MRIFRPGLFVIQKGSASLFAVAFLLAAGLHAQDFAVASIHMTQPHSLEELKRGVGLAEVSGFGTSRFTARNVPLEAIVSLAFDKQYDQIANAPDWLDSQLYDVAAETDGDKQLSREEMRPLLQHLLEQRFHLKVHAQTLESPGYALIVAQSSPNLKPSTQPKFYAQFLPDGIQGTDCPMSTLAAMLRRPTHKPVEDETGLKGNFDFKLSYAPDGVIDSPLASIFTALKEQLGLQLQPKKIRVEQLVIDHVDRVPVEN